jgi:hypothetical protein
MTFLFTFSTLIFAFSFTQYAIQNKKYEVRILTYEIINLFLQNEPNFQKSQVNVNIYEIMDYAKMDTWSIRKNEPKRTQNEPKLKKAEMNVKRVLTMDYENISNWAICENEPKTNPILAQKIPKQTQFKHRQSQLHLLIIISAAIIIFSQFGALLLTRRYKSRKVPDLYFPVVLFRLFEGISKCRNRRPIRV